MDLILDVLLAIEAERGMDEEYTSKDRKKTILYHHALAMEAGLLDGEVIPQSLEKDDELILVHSGRQATKPHVAPGTDGRNQLQSEAVSTVPDDGRFPQRAPRGAPVVVGTNRRFIDKVNLRPD